MPRTARTACNLTGQDGQFWRSCRTRWAMSSRRVRWQPSPRPCNARRRPPPPPKRPLCHPSRAHPSCLLPVCPHHSSLPNRHPTTLTWRRMSPQASQGPPPPPPSKSSSPTMTSSMRFEVRNSAIKLLKIRIENQVTMQGVLKLHARPRIVQLLLHLHQLHTDLRRLLLLHVQMRQLTMCRCLRTWPTTRHPGQVPIATPFKPTSPGHPQGGSLRAAEI